MIATLFVVIVASWADLFARPAEARSVVVERRAPAPYPKFDGSLASWTAFPEAFQSWFDDHFGLRDRFLYAHSALRVFGFGVAPSEDVVLGRDRWLFSTAQRSVEVYRGAAPFTERQLEAWRRALESRRDRLAQSGIQYVYAIAPSKQFVYPEFVPERLDVVGPSRMDQLVAHLLERSDLEVLDLRAALVQAKRQDEGGDYAYYPLGTHWTDRGGFAAVAALRERLEAQFLKSAALGDLPAPTYREVERQGDSWADRLYLSSALTQSVRALEWPQVDRSLWMETIDGPRRRRTVETGEATRPRALVFHDSFGEGLFKTLPRLFSRTTFVWCPPELDHVLIERERPDVVVQLYVDRTLVAVTPRGEGDVDQIAAQQAFDSSKETLLSWDAVANEPPCRPRRFVRPVAQPAGASQIGFSFDVELAAGTLLLPEFGFPESGNVVVALSLECPASARGALMYRTKATADYVRTRQVPLVFEAGLNELYVELLESDLDGPLLVWPGAPSGRFTLSRFEARATR